MDPKEKSKKGYYGSLKGLHRAMPIILVALAIFIGICFISGEAGALGSGFSSLLRGLFSTGAYAIPFLLALHGIFYAEDYAKKRLISRIVFSVIAILVISSIEYTIVFWGKEFVFAPTEYYTEKTAGGLIGSTVAFGLVKMLGTVGVYILAVALIAIYFTFFFSGQNTAFGRVVFSILAFFTGILALIERGIKKLFGKAKKVKENKRKRDHQKKNQELLDDQFFQVDNGISELKISQLGILESKNGTEAKESEPTVVQNAAERKEASFDKRSVNLDYGITAQNVPGAFVKAPEPSFTSSATSTQRQEAPSSYGLDESADKVFSQSFDPFDFATNERLAAKASTRAIKEESVVISEVARPLSSMTNEEIEKERRRVEFERRKKMIIEMRSKSSQAQAPKEEAVNAPSEHPSASTEESASYTPAQKTVEFNVSNAPTELKRNPTEGSTFKGTFGKQEYREHDAERAAAHVAEIVAMNNPAYAKSSNEVYTYVKITESDAMKEAPVETPASFTSEENDSYTTSENTSYADISVSAENNYEQPLRQEDGSEDELPCDVGNETFEEIYSEPTAQAPEFKPYTPPTADSVYETGSTIAEDTLKIERTMVSPTPETPSERDKRYTLLNDEMEILTEKEEDPEEGFSFSFGDEDELTKSSSASLNADTDGEIGTVFSFEDEIEEDETAFIEEKYNELPEDEAITSEEIPPEEQNPEVISQRAMFPFLDREEANEEEAEEDEEEETDDDEPSFEEDEIAEEEEGDLPPFEPTIEKSTPSVNAVVPVNEPAKKQKQEPKKADYSSYQFPPIDLLGKDEKNEDENDEEEIQDNADRLIETLASFNVTASIKGVDRGPRITRYEVVPAKGVKVSSVMNLQDDIALGLAAEGIRMEAPIPGKSAIGVEIPNAKAETVRLRELLETEEFVNAKSKTAICIGKDVTGQPVINDIAKMPHLLIAGATGMGKSVCINSLMISMLYKARPDEVKFIMIDPKQVEFTMYNGIPHLLVPVVSDAKQAAGSLMWAVEEMERRYNLLNTQCVRNVDAYNEKVKEDPSIGEPISRIVIVIDEFADLMLQVRDPVENLVMRIAQKARAAGIHLIIGTQRPAVNVITGTIKANVPSRISCKVASNIDSRTVLDASGAEKLLNKGDMLFSFAGAINPLRVQGAFVKDSEVEAIMKYLKQFSDGQSYDQSVMEQIERAAQKCSKKGSGSDRDDDDDDGSGEGYLNDRQFLDAVELAVNSGKIATSLIQRKLSIGYGKAAKFIDIMEDMGIVGEGNGPKPREVLLTADEWREKLARSMID